MHQKFQLNPNMDGPVVKSKIQEDQDSRLQIMIEDKVFTISDSDSDDDKNKDERPLDSQRTVLTRKNFRRQLQSYLRASYSPDKCELKPEVCDTWKRPDERLEASSGKQKVVASVDKHESADLQDSQHAAVEPISGKILSPLILTKAGIPNGPDKCGLKPYVCDGSDTWKEPDERLKASSGKRKALVSNKTLKEKMKRQKVGFDTSFDNYMRAFFNQKPSQAPTLLDISLLEDGAANLSLPKKIGKCSRMREFVGFKKPESLDRHEVTLLDALMFKFPLINVLPNAKTTNVEVNVNNLIIKQQFVTFKEIYLAFMSLPSTNSSLVSEVWLANAYKIIILKLAYFENSFVAFKKFEILNPETVINQLNYRYKKEIVGGERPILRRIVELGDSPTKRMVLRVLSLLKNNQGDYDVTVTDGWYTIRCTFDKVLQTAVELKKLKINDKLITSNAELKNCINTNILKVPKNVRLIIHGNSTRKALWDTKLGLYSEHISPLPICLGGVKAEGGIIGEMILYVVHQHPNSFVEHTSSGDVVRSERQEVHIKREMARDLYEKKQEHFAKLQSDYDEEELLKKKNIAYQRICFSIDEVGDLCDLIENSKNSDLIQARLTNDQKTNVKLENDRRRNVKSEEILRRANVDNMYPHFPERKVQKIKQFRVLDAKNPTATVRFSIWDPSKEVEDLVQTKGFIRVCGAVATCNNYITEIEIRNSEVTTIEKWKGNVEDNLDKFKTYFRHLTPISEVNNQDFAPLQNEFDILCIVIDLHKHSGIIHFQRVYVADERGNVLAINFWDNLNDLVLENVVSLGSTLYIKNLQWRGFNKKARIQEGYHANFTEYIANPSGPEMDKFLMALTQPGNKDIYINCSLQIKADLERITDDYNTSKLKRTTISQQSN